MKNAALFDKVYGCLLGGVIGDAMGAPVEGWRYTDIEEKLGEVCDFSGDGTDNSAIRIILCEAILQNDGYVSADEFAASFLTQPADKKLFLSPSSTCTIRSRRAWCCRCMPGWATCRAPARPCASPRSISSTPATPPGRR